MAPTVLVWRRFSSAPERASDPKQRAPVDTVKKKAERCPGPLRIALIDEPAEPLLGPGIDLLLSSRPSSHFGVPTSVGCCKARDGRFGLLGTWSEGQQCEYSRLSQSVVRRRNRLQPADPGIESSVKGSSVG